MWMSTTWFYTCESQFRVQSFKFLDCPMSILIRPVTLEDEPVVQTLFAQLDEWHYQAYPQAFQPPANPARPADLVQEVIHRPDATILVAEVEKQVVGMVFGTVYETTKSPLRPVRYVHIHDIVVKPTFQGQGVAQALLKGIKTWTQEQDAAHLELNVLYSNHRAIRFYEREGFTFFTHRMRLDL